MAKKQSRRYRSTDSANKNFYISVRGDTHAKLKVIAEAERCTLGEFVAKALEQVAAEEP